jgi:hypothetical protein
VAEADLYARMTPESATELRGWLQVDKLTEATRKKKVFDPRDVSVDAQVERALDRGMSPGKAVRYKAFLLQHVQRNWQLRFSGTNYLPDIFDDEQDETDANSNASEASEVETEINDDEIDEAAAGLCPTRRTSPNTHQAPK